MAEPFTDAGSSGEMNDFFDELSSAPVPEQKSGSNRMRVTKDLISYRYRWKQFRNEVGIEALLLLIFSLTIFFHFRPMLQTPANYKLLSIAGTAASGNTPVITTGTKSSYYMKRTQYASSAILPETALTWISGGGSLAATLTGLLLWGTSLIFTYFTVRRQLSRVSGIAGALLLAVFPAVAAGASALLLHGWLIFYITLTFSLFIRSRQQKNAILPFFSGIAAAGAFYCHPAAAVFAIILPLLPETALKKRFVFIGGTLAGTALFSGGFALLHKTPLFHDVKALTGLFSEGVGATVPLGGLFYRMATEPALLPFAILSLFAIGYTFRTPKTSYPHLPFHLLMGCYFLLEFFPVSLKPYQTLAGSPDLSVILAVPFVLLLSPFITGIGGRPAVRWITAAVAIGSLPLLFF